MMQPVNQVKIIPVCIFYDVVTMIYCMFSYDIVLKYRINPNCVL